MSNPWQPQLPFRRWLTSREAADYLALRLVQFEHGVKTSGLKPAHFVDGEPRYDVQAIDSFMENQIKTKKDLPPA
ncbi:MAG: hypothetical protein AAGC72_09850 [Planctomycetota bacterium]